MYKPNQPMRSAQDEDGSIFDDEDYSVRKRNFFFFQMVEGAAFYGHPKKRKKKKKKERKPDLGAPSKCTTTLAFSQILFLRLLFCALS